ncbi:very long chain fatty acid elongase 7-like [Prorops nasuta]|uniref:very long chain fatty acid elongase 7-like n=1 Tax=Prorops nasuta TaxID=863751 RepID=UPI0034CDD72F
MSIAKSYQYYVTEMADPRTNDWMLVGSPIPLTIILFNYLYFVLVFGPKYMRHRKPYSLKNFMFFYNIFQIFVNAYFIYGVITSGWTTDISLFCEPVRYTTDELPMRMTRVIWAVYMVKLIDLMETIVFVLRKKKNQISFLHLYHHISTVIIAYLSLKYIAGGMATFCVIVNSFVHVIMYTYYLCSGNLNLQYLVVPIKPYITIIQMVQFCILLIHTFQAFMPSCHVPRLAPVIMTFNLLINFYLFYDFYNKNYRRKAKNIK